MGPASWDQDLRSRDIRVFMRDFQYMEDRDILWTEAERGVDYTWVPAIKQLPYTSVSITM